MMTTRLNHGKMAKRLRMGRSQFRGCVVAALSVICLCAKVTADSKGGNLPASSPSAPERTSDENIDSQCHDMQLTEAFRSGLGGVFRDEISLFATRTGQHWTFEGKDRAGVEVGRLTCLLCTEEEVLSSVAFLGNRIRLRIEGASSSSEEFDSDSATLSIGGRVVPPYVPQKSAGEVPLQDEPSPGRTLRIRLAVAFASLGVSAAVMGGIFWWMDGNCANEGCSKLHSLKGPAVGLVVSSGLFETAAVLLFCLKRKRGTAQ